MQLHSFEATWTFIYMGKPEQADLHTLCTCIFHFQYISIYFQVYFEVSGNNPAMDVYPPSGSLSFTDGQTFSAINLQVLHDSAPELHEDYTISLTEASGLAVIGSTDTASFRIRY